MKDSFSDPSFRENRALPIHRWVPWIGGFSAAFVGDCVRMYLPEEGVLLDPFCGVGTSLLVAQPIASQVIGFDINPYAILASRLKLTANHVDTAGMKRAWDEFQRHIEGGTVLSEREIPAAFGTRIPFYSPEVLSQVNAFLNYVDRLPSGNVKDLFLIAFGSVMVGFSNYSYEPSLSSRPGAGRGLIEDADVFGAIKSKVEEIVNDVALERASEADHLCKVKLYRESLIRRSTVVPNASVDLIVTSPPYLNNYHYVRNSRPQLFWLELVTTYDELRVLQDLNFGKYWQTVRARPKPKLAYDHSELLLDIARLEAASADRGLYSGAGWAKYLVTYFNDVHKLLNVLHRKLKPGGRAVFVLGDSVLQGEHIQVDVRFMEVAERIGFEVHPSHSLRVRGGASITGSSVRRGNKTSVQLRETAVSIQKRPDVI